MAGDLSLPFELEPLSKKLSNLLRHKGPLAGLHLDEEGWCNLDQLRSHKRIRRWNDAQLSQTINKSKSHGQSRFELSVKDGMLCIRATYKRSITDSIAPRGIFPGSTAPGDFGNAPGNLGSNAPGNLRTSATYSHSVPSVNDSGTSVAADTSCEKPDQEPDVSGWQNWRYCSETGEWTLESTGWRPDTSDGINPDTSGNIHGSASERDELIVKNERALAIVGASYDGETEFGQGVLSLKKKDLIWDSGREDRSGWAWVEYIGADSGEIEKCGWFPPTGFQRLSSMRAITSFGGEHSTGYTPSLAVNAGCRIWMSHIDEGGEGWAYGFLSDEPCQTLEDHGWYPASCADRI